MDEFIRVVDTLQPQRGDISQHRAKPYGVNEPFILALKGRHIKHDTLYVAPSGLRKPLVVSYRASPYVRICRPVGARKCQIFFRHKSREKKNLV